MSVLSSIVQTRAPRATVLIRLMVGVVFLSEGVQKFLYPGQLGVGRFTRIGLPAPEVLAPFVGCVEVLGGTLLLIGLLIRPAALALSVDMAVAIVTTKLPILLGHGFWGLGLRELGSYGLASMVHESRTDWAMLLGSLFLLTVGAGPWSLDAVIAHRAGARASR